MQTPCTISTPIGGDCKSDSDQSSGSKRRRAPNFTDKEIRILIKLIFDHIEIIENKKTDSETWRVKDLVWNSITENFNKYSGVSKRTVEMIRQKYDTIKKLARKKEAKNREELGKEDPDFIEMEEYERDLIRLLEPITGNSYDPAAILPDPKFGSSNIKPELGDFKDNDRFIVTDEDVLWDMPNDLVNRPRLQLIKRQLEHLEREEQRQITEHECRMRTQEVKRKVLLQQERRARIEHKKRMELLELEIAVKQKVLEVRTEQLG